MQWLELVTCMTVTDTLVQPSNKTLAVVVQHAADLAGLHTCTLRHQQAVNTTRPHQAPPRWRPLFSLQPQTLHHSSMLAKSWYPAKRQVPLSQQRVTDLTAHPSGCSHVFL